MAKLNGVVLLAETIEYNGVKYAKSDEDAVKGDIIRFEDDRSYVTNGAFYEVTRIDSSNDPQIIDNDGDEYDLCGKEYTVFKRVESETIPQSSEDIVHNGITYRKVSRKPSVGNVVAVTSQEGHEHYDLGSVFTLKNEQGRGDYGKKFGVGGTYIVWEQDITVLEPIQTQTSDNIIVVDGVKYRKVDRKPIVGDFVYATESFNGMTKGKVYELTALYDGVDYEFKKDDGKDGLYPFIKRGRVLVEKVTESSAPTPPVPEDIVFIDGIGYAKEAREAKVGEKVETIAYWTHGWPSGVIAVCENGGYFRSDVKTTMNMCDDQYTQRLNEKCYNVLVPKYREVKRKAKLTELLHIVNSGDDRYQNGEIFVTDEARSGGVFVKHPLGENNGRAYVYNHEYVVLEPIESAEQTQPKRLQVGDYAKVIGGSNFETKIGDIVIIREVDLDGDFGINDIFGKKINGCKLAKNVVRATDAEIAEFKRKVAERDRLKVGEYAKVVNPLPMFNKIGDIVKITEDDRSDCPFNTEHVDGRYAGWNGVADLIRATDAEVAEAKAQAHKATFKIGDYARVVNDNYEHRVGHIVKINEFYDGSAPFDFGVDRLTIGDTGYIAAKNIEKLTAEEAKTVLDPRNKFAVGDSVKLISGGDNHPLNGFKNNGIYTVVDPKSKTHGGTIEIAKADGRNNGYAKPEQLVKLTAEEAEALRKQAEEASKWTKIGRKVDEYKVGDLVRITRFQSGAKEGAIVTVKSMSQNAVWYDGGWGANLDAIELIAPVESLFTKASA